MNGRVGVEREEVPLHVEAATVTSERAVGGQHPVAGYDDRHGVAVHRLAHRPGRPRTPREGRELAVADGLTGLHLTSQRLERSPMEAAHGREVDRNVEVMSEATEVLAQLIGDATAGFLEELDRTVATLDLGEGIDIPSADLDPAHSTGARGHQEPTERRVLVPRGHGLGSHEAER